MSLNLNQFMSTPNHIFVSFFSHKPNFRKELKPFSPFKEESKLNLSFVIQLIILEHLINSNKLLY